MSRKKSGAGKKILIVIVLIILIVLGVFGYIKFGNMNSTQNVSNENVLTNEVNQVTNEVIVEEPVIEKTVEIFKGDDRPIAVMIDNHDDARPQVAINDAYIVYEIIVEGGYTRMMPIFKGQDIDKIGPVRSARHYFLDYALEHDAIFVHFGHSPQAESDIKKLDVEDIEGLYYSSKQFTRTSGKYAPHNVIVSTDSILDIAEDKNYKLTSNKESVLNYTVDEVKLEDGISAEKVYIPFSTSQNVTFEYDEDEQRYVKYANKKKQTDWVSKDDITFKNIIITFADNYALNDSSGKGRQGLSNTGKKDGYYITNGKAIEITCTKNSRESQTIYKDLDGNEINISDGNTYVGICPLNAKVKITPGEKEAEENEVSNEITNEV